MARVDIKICGLTDVAAIDAALDGGASHVGFVHFARSPRHLAPDRLALIATRLPPHVRRVGVLVDPDDMLVDALVTAGGLHVLQLHGSETPARAAALAARTGLEVWKAIPVRTAADVAMGGAYVGAVHRLLYDARTQEGALPGGMGHRFDWTLLSGHRAPLPWALSGGLDAENVAQAIHQTGAPLVDVSSGVESTPGVKDVDKIAAFCKAVAQC